MNNSFKQLVRKYLLKVPFSISKNLDYDKLTLAIMDKVLKIDSVCVDVGCHKGEVLDEMIKRSPQGKFFAFEPIPVFYNELKEKYTSKNCTLFNCALGSENGNSKFNFVRSNPAYSGLRKREYKRKDEEIEEINVEVKRLDDLIDNNIKVDLIKIDVEGGEFAVLKGGYGVIKRSKPVIIFEFGLGASDYYGTKPEDLYTFLSIECGLKVFTLKNWIKNGSCLTKEEFERQYFQKENYYFLADGESK